MNWKKCNASILKLGRIFFFLFFSSFVFGQTLSSNLSKSRIGIGETAKFTITINQLNGKKVIAAPKNQLLPFHFTILSDSISIVPNTYSRTINFKVFEEGKFTIPALEVKVGEDILTTVPYEVEVYNTANPKDTINDIMQNKEKELSWKDYLLLYKMYLLAFLVLLAIIFIIWKMKKSQFFKKNPKTPKEFTNATIKELEALKSKNYIENGNYRQFYVELLDISRKFIVIQYKIPADILLTDDLLAVIKKSNAIAKENEVKVGEVFNRGDLVKFAKTIPTKEIMQKDYEEIYQFVKNSTKEIEAHVLREGNVV